MVRRRNHEKRIDPLTHAISAPILDDSQYETLLQLALLPDNEWQRQSEFRPALRSPITVGDLIRHSRWFLGRAPQKSIVIAEMALRVAEAQREDETAKAEADHKKGEAWQAYAAGLTECQDYRDALNATITAERLYFASGVTRAEGLPSLKLIRARILAELGETESALLFADDAAQTFLTIFQDRVRYVNARLFCTNILLKAGRYKEAIRTLDRAAEIANEQGDTETLAHIVSSTGYALQEQANIERIKGNDEQATALFDRAKGCQEHAIEMFELVGMPSEVAQVRLTLARGFILRGAYNEGVAALQASRDEFIGLGMPIVAAEVAIDIAGAMLLAGRGAWIPQLCNAAIPLLVKAGLEREAQKAIAYLQEESSKHQGRKAPSEAISRAIAHVKEFLIRLQHDPELPFQEPETDA